MVPVGSPWEGNRHHNFGLLSEQQRSLIQVEHSVMRPTISRPCRGRPRNRLRRCAAYRAERSNLRGSSRPRASQHRLFDADHVVEGLGNHRPNVVGAHKRISMRVEHDRLPTGSVTNKGSMSGGKEKKRPGRRPRRSFYGAGSVGVSAGGSGAGDSTSADPSSTIAASSSASIASSSPSSSSRLVPSISASIAGISSDVETTP